MIDFKTIPTQFLYQGRITIPEFDDYYRTGITSSCDVCGIQTKVFHVWTLQNKDIIKNSKGLEMIQRGIGLCAHCQNELIKENTDDN